MLRAIRAIWHGQKEWSGISDAGNLWRKLPFGLLLAALLLFGCFPRLLTDDIKTSVAPLAQLVEADTPDALAPPVLKGRNP
jgi:hypothetical protein